MCQQKQLEPLFFFFFAVVWLRHVGVYVCTLRDVQKLASWQSLLTLSVLITIIIKTYT